MPVVQPCPRSARFGTFEIDLRSAELRKHGIRIRLQNQPFQILVLLLQRAGEVVTREEIRQQLWPDQTFVDFDRGLNKAMSKLRTALGDSADHPRYIETLHGRGYRFLATASLHWENTRAGESHIEETRPVSDEPAAREPATQPQALPAIETRPALPSLAPARLSPPSSHRHRALILLTVAAVLVLCAAFVTARRLLRMRPAEETAATYSPRRSVAVLGFKNLSNQAQEAWLSTALSEWLTTELSAGEQLRIIPADRVARMKIELPLRDPDSLDRDNLALVRKILGTDLVVTGAYAVLPASAGGEIRLDLRLEDTRGGETLDAISETGSETHLFDLVSRAGADLRARLGVQAVTPQQAAEVAIALPSQPEAARLYSVGLADLRTFDAQAAHALLVKAIAAEPDFALAHSALASAWVQLGYDANAQREAHTAYTLSSRLPRAERLLTEGRYRETSREWDKAIDIYRALYEFYPDNLDYGLALADVQVSAGEGKAALATIDELRQLPEPMRDDPRIDLAEGHAAETLGDFKRVQAATERAAQKAQAIGTSLLLAKARTDAAWAYENLGQLDQASASAHQAMQLYLDAHERKGVADAMTVDAIASEMRGDYLAAHSEYQQALSIFQQVGYQLGVASGYDNIGDTLLALGNLDAARQSYQQSLQTYQQIGHEDGLALARIGLGEVDLAFGRHAEATRALEASIAAAHQVGDRSKEASALADLGQALRMEGDLDHAMQDETQALATFTQIGDQTHIAQTRIIVAQILLDQRHAAAAAVNARAAADFFVRLKDRKDSAAASLTLAQARRLQGRLPEAQALVRAAVADAARSHNQELEWRTGIEAAHLQGTSGSATERSAAVNRLNAIAAQALAAGFLPVDLEARLALASLDIDSGHRDSARAHLEVLRRDAERSGLRQFAVEAAALQPSPRPRF